MLGVVSCYLTSLITICVVVKVFKNISLENFKFNKKLVLLLIFGTLISTGLYYLNITILKTLYSLFFFILVFKFISQKGIIESLYYALFIWLYGMILDFAIMLVVSLLGLDIILLNMDMIYARTISSILMTVGYLIIGYIPFVKSFTKKTIDKLMKIKTSLIVEILFISILIVLNAICVVNVSKMTTHIFTIIIIVLLTAVIYTIIDKNYTVSKLKQVNKLLIKNNEFFIKLDSDYRELKHNLTAQLGGIKTVANEEAKLLIEDLIINYNSKFMSSQDIKKIPAGINGIVYEKLYSFNQKDIKLAVENSINSNILEVLKPRNYNNLCETLGILIDNSLEAAFESEDKSILIDFSETNSHIIVKVVNTFNNNLDIDSLGESGYSTKGKNHGIGLFSIFKKKNLQVKNSIINNLFQSEIRIKKVIYK